MKKNLFLTTVLLAGLVAPAFADDATTPDKKITGGAGTCTADVLGVSADGATANTIATWTLNSYDCAAGQYLDETTLLCTECPVGSYCPGGVFTVEANNSKTACPADYTSDAAATAESECYMGCELACGTNAECPENATCTYNDLFKISGKQYFDGVCTAYSGTCPIDSFSCNTGYQQDSLNNNLIDDYMSKYINTESADPSIFVNMMFMCGTGNKDLNQINDINECEFLLPGQVSFGTDVFDFSYNDYTKDSPGVETYIEYEYPDCIGEGCTILVQQEYIRNAAFINGGNGKNIWVSGKKHKLVASSTTYLLIDFFTKIMDTGNLTTPNTQYFDIMRPEVSYVYQALKTDSADAFIAEQKPTVFEYFNTKNAEKIIDVMIRTKNNEINSVEELNAEFDKIILYDILDYSNLEILDSQIYQMVFEWLERYVNNTFENKEKMAIASLPAIWLTVDQATNINQNIWSYYGELQDSQTDIINVEESLDDEQFVLQAGLFVINIAFKEYTDKEIEENWIHCIANTINIDWNPDNGGASTQNMCIYDGAITLPSDPVKPGYTFMGWKLLDGTTTE